MKTLKELVKVKLNLQDLIRLGVQYDGGYVTSRIALDASKKLYTYGVGPNWQFEKDYVTIYEHKQAEMYDHTVDVNNTGSDRLLFYKSPLATTSTSTTFDESRDNTIPVFLKLDVEGAEYDFFEKADLSTYSNVTGIVCEFHRLSHPDILVRFKKVLEKLQEYYDIIHVHGNNYASLFNEEGFIFPVTSEISFLHKNLSVNYAEYQDIEYPLKGLDCSNAPHGKDHCFKVYR